MAVHDLGDVINTLTPEEQEAVRDFILFLKHRAELPATPFLAAVDEFIEAHPELLSRLAQ